MAMIVLITATVLVHSVYGAPLIPSTESSVHITNNVNIEDGNNSTHKSLLINGLFEGDLRISEDFIRKFYDLREVDNNGTHYNNTDLMLEHKMESVKVDRGMGKRAARAGTIRLWPNAIVPYKFTSAIAEDIRHRIRDAMDHWEDRTCLRFPLQNNEADFVKYVKTQRTCSSNVGRIGLEQTINMDLERDCNFGTFVHEIGHTIGFWHEQSRPDRDSYIRILYSNIDADWQQEFYKRLDSEVDSRSSVYDYGSVMHYSTSSGCSGRGCQSMEVIDNALYRMQGSPHIGDWTNGLSSRDVDQTNNLYSCPKSGVTGPLVVYMRNGRSLPDTDPWLNSPDPYVKVTAVDSSGNHHVRDTSVQLGTTSPTWNQYILFPEREWQFFRIAIWDDDDFLTFRDDWMSVSETIMPMQGEHSSLRHCSDDDCNGSIAYDYSFHTLTTASLTVKVRDARNLKDTDPWLNLPDPYAVVRATSSDGSQKRQTHYIGGTQNPTWNSNLDFGCQRWVNFITLQVFDDDDGFTGGDDEMSTEQKTTLQSGNHVGNWHSTNGGGHLIFDYNFRIDGNECSTNPCQNGGTCVDGCSSYTCQCVPNYSGTHCEHLYGDLRFKARYARNLQDRDGWLNYSDPYMEIIAEDADGNTVKKRTRYIQGNANPDWNQWLYFGNRAWKKYKVRIYDDDDNADDPLSSQYTRTVYWGSHTSERFDCYGGGHAVYDYYFD